MSYETKIASKIMLRCSFTCFPECNSSVVVVLIFVIGILMIFPYAFYGVKILIRNKLSNFMAIDNSVTFCFITIYTVFVILI